MQQSLPTSPVGGAADARPHPSTDSASPAAGAGASASASAGSGAGAGAGGTSTSDTAAAERNAATHLHTGPSTWGDFDFVYYTESDQGRIYVYILRVHDVYYSTRRNIPCILLPSSHCILLDLKHGAYALCHVVFL